MTYFVPLKGKRRAKRSARLGQAKSCLKSAQSHLYLENLPLPIDDTRLLRGALSSVF